MSSITVIGNIGSAELKFTQSGKAALNLSLAENHRRKNPQTNEWEDTGTSWYRATLWEEQAELAADQLQKGTRVIVTGTPVTRTYTTQQGEERESREILVNAIGPAIPKRKPQDQQGGGFGGGQAQQPAADPWGQPSSGGDWGTPSNGQPAF